MTRVWQSAIAVALAILLSNGAVQAQTVQDQAVQPQATQDGAAVAGAAQGDAKPVELGLLQVAIRDAIAELAANAGKSAAKRLKEIGAHYAEAGYEPIWLAGGAATPKAEAMLKIIARAEEDGLRASDYDLAALEAMRANVGNEAVAAEFDSRLSLAAVAFGQHLNAGRINPAEFNREIVIYPREVSADIILKGLRRTKNVVAYVRLLAPHTQRYERLRLALAQYRRIAANGGYSTIAEGKVLKPGASDPRIPTIRKRMNEAGLLENVASDETYDETLAKAVMAFQERMGLEAVGTIGPQTLAAMNTPIEDRIATMEINLERNRWMQNEFGPYHIFANLADQVVKVVRNDKTVHAEIIQVGQPYHRTPVFTDTMEYVEFNPYWGVPPSIAVNEYLPKLRSNPGVLSAQNISLFSGGKKISPSAVNWSSFGKGNFPFSLRQEPGKGNALGRVKFMFPNQFNVYMHDTPSKSKFEATQRYFSHGCLRLNNPLKMAEVLLEQEGWDRKRIDATVAGGKNTVAKLKTPIPVIIAYLTTFVNKDGSVHFREDVYGRDKILVKALEKVRGS